MDLTRDLMDDEEIITPRRGRQEAAVSPRLVMAFTRPDYHRLCQLAQAPGKFREVFGCPVREGRWGGLPLCIVGPAIGAPYAVMVLEKLFALGARAVVALGWCGSLQPDLVIGDLVLPTDALSEEGTSAHYLVAGEKFTPDDTLLRLLTARLAAVDHPHRRGRVWTTDAFYRETAQKVRDYGRQGILAVDMETSALFTLGKFRRLAVAVLLVVSDELGSLKWRHGLRQPRLGQGREYAAQVVLETAAAWEDPHAEG